MRGSGPGARISLLFAIATVLAVAGLSISLAGTEPATMAALPVEPAMDYLIYQCTHDGQIVLSDQPCGPEAEIRRINPAYINIYEAPVATSRPSADRRHSGLSASRTDAAPSEKARESACKRIVAELERLRSRMRAGYRAREGERLRARQHELEERRYMLRCRPN